MTDRTVQRRHVMGGMGAVIMAASTSRAMASPDISADIEQRLAQLRKDGRVRGLHALLVAKGDRMVFEHYETGKDELWGTPLGRVTFGPTVLHDLRSVSKSVVGLLYGIALADGKVPPPEAKLYAQFPEYADLAAQPGRDRLTIAHVLTMTLGIEWDELTIPYGTAGNSENAMVDSPDRYRYILERPIIGEPGVKWIYCGGATALLGRLITKGTGEKLLDYARRVLFEPLGFGPSEWVLDSVGEPQAASGLRLLPRDMLKVGQLVLANGAWKGRQIVPADWVKRATTPVVTIEGRGGYGYQWYTGTLAAGTPRALPWASGIGWGGQRLFVAPQLDLVVAMSAGNYPLPIMEQGRIASLVIYDAVLPGVMPKG
jgi:CubicO group peptidase (beta-lactamase class C family)